MSRSIHSTYNDYGREKRSRYATPEAREERLEALRQEIRKKRRVKRRVGQGRGAPPWADLPPVAAEAVPIRVVEEGPWVHYPASPDDLRAVMRRLPAGVLTGLSGVRLCLGSKHQEKGLSPEERARAGRDPLVGRVGYENLPGVFGGRYLGTYFRPARIDLYAYVYDPAFPGLATWELYLRLRMLSTFVHEVAHHDDATRRVARGRWRMDDTDKNEGYAGATQARWVQQCVVPYLEEAYPEAVREFGAWLSHHGGTEIPLALLAGGWRWDAEGKAVPLYFGSACEAFGELAEGVHKGEPLTANRLEFARYLHYGENYAEALRILGRVLGEEPANPEALTLQADVLEHQGEHQLAEALARQVVTADENYTDAWMVLADVYEGRQEWGRLLEAAGRGVRGTDPSDWNWRALLVHRGRANLELANFADLAADVEALEAWAEGRSHSRDAAALRALLLLRTGRCEEALQVALLNLGQKCLPRHRAILTAARFEAAHRLGRPDEAGTLPTDVIDTLRHLHYGGWVDRLAGLGPAS
jgi:tetratricopeptide (TPR) repeat protein